MLLRYPIAMLPLADLQEYDIVEHCQLRRKEGALPQTINVEISNLRALFKLSKPVFRLAINDQIFRDVYSTLVYMNVVVNKIAQYIEIQFSIKRQGLKALPYKLIVLVQCYKL